MSHFRVGLIGVVGLLGSVALCRADVAAVNKYLGEAKELVSKGTSFFGDATSKLELAEASLDDVPAAEKPALEAQIKALKTQISAAANTEQKGIVERKIKRLIDDAEGSIGNLVTWPGTATELKEILADPKTTEVLGAEAVAGYQKQFATFQKLHGTKALTANLATAKERVDTIEKSWAESKTTLADKDASPNAKESALQSVQRDLEGTDRVFADLPADNADVKALRDRLAKVQSESIAAAGDAGAGEELAKIDRFLESYKENFDGMDAETAPASWADYKSQKAGAGQFGAPKTAEYVSRVGGFLKDLQESESYKTSKENPKVKAAVAQLQTKVDAGRKKITGFATKMVDEALTEKVNEQNVGSFTVIRETLANTDEADPATMKTLSAKVNTALEDRQKAGETASADLDAYYKKLSEEAARAWPDMLAKFTTEEGFDPSNPAAFKGKLVKIETDNLMGYRFKPNDFAFATTLNGKPVAGRYDPAVKAAIAKIETKLGRSLGDSDDDGKWTIVARVEGNTGQLLQMIDHEGDVTVDGTKVGTITGTETKPVEAPIITIVAAHCGPLAVAAGQGAVNADGSVSAVAPASGMDSTANSVAGPGIGSRLVGIISGLLGLALGVACLMKAGFAPLASNANAVQLQQRVGGQNLIYLGIAGIVWGALGVVFGLLALPGAFIAGLITLLMSAAMVVAGFTVSSSELEQRQLVKPDLAAKIKSFAVPAGLACAVLSVLGIVRNLIP